MKPVMMIRCAALTLASLVATSAFAVDSPERTPTRVVKYGDLNVNSKSGVATLYRRIRFAADAVCRDPQGVRRLVDQADLTNCKRDSTDRAIAEANLPMLSSLHFARTGRTVPNTHVAQQR